MSQFGEDTLPPEEEAPVEENEARVKIRISVFFDGTLNNRTNTEARVGNKAVYQQYREGDNSYNNDLSNIAKMEQYVDQAEGFHPPYKLYIEGIGTTDEDDDSSTGYAFGKGSTGVKAKVADGMRKVVSQIGNEIKPGTIIEELSIDAFGFSRGAAAARFFIYELLSEFPVSKGRRSVPARPIHKRLELAGFVIDSANIKIRFVGLFDTVASEGLSHTNDTFSLKLDAIGRPEVERVVHLASADEHRKNFSLTNIDSAIAKGIGKEVFLPGVHSDIGGGYRDDSNENLHLNQSFSKNYIERDRQKLIDYGYYQPSEISIQTHFRAGPHGVGNEEYFLWGKRAGIKHHYARIPLNIMVEFSRQAGMNISNEMESYQSIPESLQPVFNDLKTYAKGSGVDAQTWLNSHPYPWLPELRHKYLHFSAQLKASYVVVKPHQPNFEEGERERAVNVG